MILGNTTLQKREADDNPIRVAIVGAGFVGGSVALQVLSTVVGIRLVAIANCRLDWARRVYAAAGVKDVAVAETAGQLEDAVRRGHYAITEDALLLCHAEGIDAILDLTRSIEFAARLAIEAIAARKHVIMLNAALDATVGPILKVLADRAGVVITHIDGDQPGVMMNLYRFVQRVGGQPILAGTIRGRYAPSQQPITPEGSSRWRQPQSPMVMSLTDGTTMAFEQAIVANATGMRVARRGMYGPTVPLGTPIQEAVQHYPLDTLTDGAGMMDYVAGAIPSPGVFVIGKSDHPIPHRSLNRYKLGSGLLYCFYTPYALCHFDVPTTIARAVLCGKATIAPLGPSKVEVVTTAKHNLRAGDVLDGAGSSITFGQCENADVVNKHHLLPLGIAEGCLVLRDLRKDQVLTYGDVALPAGRLCDRLRTEQTAYFQRHMARHGGHA
jgi:predicted homoserine dehydrogenase-like protein